MRSALFIREFRTALIPNLVTVGAILGTLVVLERLLGPRLGRAEDIRDFIDVALLVGLVVSGFISGERCFPAELKESRILFLASLPISRSSAWLAIVSARLLAGLSSLACAVMLRPPLLAEATLFRLDIGSVLALTIFAYVLFFSVGTLFALLFRKPLFSYTAGFLLLGFLLIETFFSCSYFTWLPQLSSLVRLPEPYESLPSLPLMAFLSLLLILGLLNSWRFFVRGEIGNPKRRIRNQILFAITATAYLGALFSVASSPRLASIGGTWGSPVGTLLGFVQNWPLSYGVSADGRYLFVFEAMDRRLFAVRVSTVDTWTARVIGRSVYDGAGWGYWSGRGDVLNLLVLNNSPFDRLGYLVDGTMDWIRLSPEAREISKLRLKGVEEVKILEGGRALVVLQEGDQGRVVLLDGTSGRSSEMARARLDGKVLVQRDGAVALVYFDNVLQPRSAWVIDSQVHKLQVPRFPVQTPYVLFGEIFGSPDEVQTALRRRFSAPLAPGGAPIRGSFLLPRSDHAWILTGAPDVKGVYFLEERAPGARGLWVRSTGPKGRWEKLQDSALDTTLVDFASGTVAFFSVASGAKRLFVYDPSLGVTLAVRGESRFARRCTFSERTLAVAQQA